MPGDKGKKDRAKRDKKGRFQKGTAIIGVPFKQGNSGRQSGYTPDLDDLARRFCLLTNATDELLAEFLGISKSTLTNWKQAHPSFLAAIRAGKEEADMAIAESVAFAATGGMIEEEQAVKVRAKDPASGRIVEDVRIVPVRRYVPPNVQAQRMWLMNRSRYWRPENDQPDDKPPQVVNNTFHTTIVLQQQVKAELSEIFGDALPGEAAGDSRRVN